MVIPKRIQSVKALLIFSGRPEVLRVGVEDWEMLTELVDPAQIVCDKNGPYILILGTKVRTPKGFYNNTSVDLTETRLFDDNPAT